MSIVIRGASLLGEQCADLRIEDGVITEVGTADTTGATQVIDADGLVALPGLVDLHTHLREPGPEDAETVLSGSQAAAMGDDWPDLPVLTRCAFAVAPPHAHPEVRARARYVTQAAAGSGAAREFCDLLLVASGRYAQLLEAYQ